MAEPRGPASAMPSAEEASRGEEKGEKRYGKSEGTQLRIRKILVAWLAQRSVRNPHRAYGGHTEITIRKGCQKKLSWQPKAHTLITYVMG